MNSLWYRWMVKEWKKEPEWATVDRIYTSVMRPDELLQEQRAKELAWQVFFLFKVTPFIERQVEESGDME